VRTLAAAARLRDYAGLVKVAHSVFALPFALLSLLVATHGHPSLRLLLLVVAAVVAARTSAMAYNRFADRDVDAANPRTRGREVPRGAVSPAAALTLALGAGGVFLGCCWLLGSLTFWFGIPVWLWLLAYSHSKRFTVLCHLWLGTALGLAPVAAWLAADGRFSSALWAPVALGLGVACWVAGFDILYACQDEAFDREHSLRSLPAALGPRRAMFASRGLHTLAVLLFLVFGWQAGLGVAYHLGVAAAAAMLWWQHHLLEPGNLARIHTAFFTANGMLSLGMLLAGCVDLYL
jgi:4-hydroxybenzoate polyprenyltransferase